MKKKLVRRMLGLGMAFAMTLTAPVGLNGVNLVHAEENKNEESKEENSEEKLTSNSDGETTETTASKSLESESGETKPSGSESENVKTLEEKPSVNITSVIVNTEVEKLGQYPKNMVINFEEPLEINEGESLKASDFKIKASKTGWLQSDISEKDIDVAVKSVELSADEKTLTLVPEEFPDRYYYVPEFTVFNEEIDGFFFTKEDTTTVTPIADDFRTVQGDGFTYNFYEPKTEEKAPIIVVFHGFGDDENLYANRIVVKWATSERQNQQKAYVLAPEFGGYNYINKDARKQVYTKTMEVIDELVEEGKVDPDRIYVTGKSFGGASVIEFNELYPEYATASIAMAPAVAYTNYFEGVTEKQNLKKIKNNSIWVAQCESDITAPFNGTKKMMATLDELGADDITLTTYSEAQLNDAGARGDFHAVECLVMEDNSYANWLFSKNKNASTKSKYEVILPESYGNIDKRYPTVYVMPNDGINSFSANMMKQIDTTFANTMDMVVVKVSFDKNDNPYTFVKNTVLDVERKYRVVSGAKYRAVIGEEVGGYLAHAFAYTDGNKEFLSSPQLFGLVASINGDYTSDDNMWIDQYGDMLSVCAKLNNATALRYYTYLSTASEDERSTATNGANSIIKHYIGNASAYGGVYTSYFGNADAYSQNFSIKNGSFNASFENKAVYEAITGFNRRLTQNLVTGTLSLSPQSALADVEEIKANYRVIISDSFTTYFGNKESDLGVSVEIVNPDNGEVIYKSEVENIEVNPGNYSGNFIIPNDVRNVSSQVNLIASLQGVRFLVDSQDLVRILATGTVPEDQVIDFMGTWKVNPISENDFKKADWVDDSGKLSLGDFSEWKNGTPCIDWWNGSNGVEKNFVGYAWYVKEFDIPADFPQGTYQMPIGYLDEGDVTFINGVQIGQTGMKADTWKYESDQWDTYRSYEVKSDILNIGGKNYIVVLAHNKSGDGGWYKGHPGLYSQAAYNKLNSVPSQKAEDTSEELVLRAVEKQIAAIENKDIESFANTVAPDYFQSGNTKEMLLDTVLDYINGESTPKVSDKEGTVFDADGLYLYQARRTVKTADGRTINMDVEDYFKIVGEEAVLYGLHDRFFTQYIESGHRAKALGQDGTAKENFLVYLPEGYFDEKNADKRYPVAYIFHQINSSSNSWKIDGINELLDEGIAKGDIKNTILVIPDSMPTSWWQGEWINMVTDDIIPFIDENYRTVDDARFRFTVGASMGGSGSYNIGLKNPNLFSGIISYFGAINMGDMPLEVARSQYEAGYEDYLRYYTQYFVCGNQDLYKFGMPAIELDAILRNVKINHFFEIEEGAHDSSFYKPYVIDSFKYVTANIPSATKNDANEVVTVKVLKTEIKDKTATVKASIELKSKIKSYLATIPESDYTTTTTPELKLPVTVRVVDENGVTLARKTADIYVSKEATVGAQEISFDISDYDLNSNENYTVLVAANLFDYPAVAAVKTDRNGIIIPVINPVTPSAEQSINASPATSASVAMKNDSIVAGKVNEIKTVLDATVPTVGKITKSKSKKVETKVVTDDTSVSEDSEKVASDESDTIVDVQDDTEVDSVDDTKALEDEETPLAIEEGNSNILVFVLILFLAVAVCAVSVSIGKYLRQRK